MAGFKTHISTSTALGIGYGALGVAAFDVPLPSAILAGGLCSVSGMLPDLDSDSGVPLRESIAFTAAVVPMFLMKRLEHMGLPPETIVLGGAAVYVMIRFGLAKMLKWYTVHRGMFHSLPAAVIAAELAYLLCTGDIGTRIYKASAVFLGFMSHLVLDEIYSVEWKRGRWRLKKSFGTAFKMWGKSAWGNLSTYGKLALLTYLVVYDPIQMPAAYRQPVTEAPKFEPDLELVNSGFRLSEEQMREYFRPGPEFQRADESEALKAARLEAGMPDDAPAAETARRPLRSDGNVRGP